MSGANSQIYFSITGEKEIAKSMTQLSMDAGVPISFICKDQARLFCVGLIKVIGNDPTQSIGKQKKLGRDRVAEDINSLFMHEKAFLERNENYDLSKAPFAGVSIEKHHLNNRTSSGGVKKRGAKKKVARRIAINRYIKTQQAKVMTAKAGFIAPLLQLVKETKARRTGVPAFLEKAKVPIQGEYRSTLTNYGTGSVRVTNRIGYANDILSKKGYGAEERKRKNDMLRQTKKRIKLLEEQYQKTLGE